MTATVQSLYIYPIKSCKAIELKQMKVTENGPQWDRNWVVIDELGKFISQRNCPKLSQVEVKIENEQLVFGHESHGWIQVPLNQKEEKKEFDIWGQTCWGWEVSRESSRWFSDYLQRKCYFINSAEEFFRQSSSKRSHSANLVYADGYPFLMISQASLEVLEQQMNLQKGQLKMNRFRPNIVVSGMSEQQEDELKSFSIGELKFQAVKACPRCVVVNVDQENSKLNNKVLKTLATYRKTSEGILFGQNLVHLNTGHLCVGDEILPWV
ncbi:MAG: MOSC domain-containing protein [Bdellovibrionales bacterium]|nr:MOSC domain-containing protein [Bdellovibrionales bacterium]